MRIGHRASVLVLALGRDPLPPAVTEAALRWEAEGVSLLVLTLTRRTRLTAAAQQITLFEGRPLFKGVDPSTAGAPRSVVRKALRQLHLDPVRWVAALLILASPRARRLVAGADVILAADPASVPLGWVLARRRGKGKVLRTVSAVDRALRLLVDPGESLRRHG